MDATHAATMVLSSYRGVSATTAVTATKNVDAGVASHTTPAVTVPGGSWVVSVWSEKSTAASTWTAPTGSHQAGGHPLNGGFCDL